ncbi:MAG: hypothetical protein E7571_00310 [Ruminococcaceae bacterium]|nr:hypothetical protein [Oscillospiraceae bacterium]
MKTIQDYDFSCVANHRAENIEQMPHSLLIASEKKIYVPENRIILLDQMSEQESQIINRIVF